MNRGQEHVPEAAAAGTENQGSREKGMGQCRNKQIRQSGDKRVRQGRGRRFPGQVCSGMLLRWAGVLAVFCLVFWGILAGAPASAWAETSDRRVYDQAGLWNQEEISRLESRIRELRDQMKMDVVLVTTSDALGKTSRDYADDFYDQGGFGTRKDYSGVLYLIDLDNRELYISTSGAMIRFLTDSRIGETLDHGYDLAVAGDYKGVADSFLTDTGAWYRKGIPGGQYNYDPETGKISRYRRISLLEAVIALAVAAGSATLVCMNVKKEYAMEAVRSQASNFLMAYRADCQFALHNQHDNLVNSFTTQAIIPRPQSTGRPGGSSFGGGGRSSTHTSSGGRTHGGGGRRF